jgi:hypothetical protein
MQQTILGTFRESPSGENFVHRHTVTVHPVECERPDAGWVSEWGDRKVESLGYQRAPERTYWRGRGVRHSSWTTTVTW